MPVQEQVVLIYAATKGHLDKLPVEIVPRFESEFLEAMRTKYSEVLTKLEKEKELTDEIVKEMDKVIGEFMGEFEKTVKVG